MTDKVFEELLQLRETGKMNMLDVQAAFPLALEMGLDALADFIFEHTKEYCACIISGQRD